MKIINLGFIEKLRPIAKRNRCSLSQLAISWVLRRSEVTSAIVGARSPSQIEETTTVVPLTETDIKEIEAYLLERDSNMRKI